MRQLQAFALKTKLKSQTPLIIHSNEADIDKRITRQLVEQQC